MYFKKKYFASDILVKDPVYDIRSFYDFIVLIKKIELVLP